MIWLNRLVRWVFACVLITALPVSTQAEKLDDPEDSDYPPGLLAEYSAGGVTVQRIDPDISFQWADQAPDVRLGSEKFTARWDGFLLMKAASSYQIHAYVQGDVRVELDGRLLLEGSAESPEWISGPVTDLSFGELPLEVTFRKTSSEAVLKLFWSSAQFAIEPIATHLLFRETGSPELARLENGRRAFRSWRCDACHVSSAADEPLSAPSLTRVRGNLSAQWISDKLSSPPATGSKMPHFALTDAQSEQIAAYLLDASEKSPKLAKIKSKKPDEDRLAGELLVRSTGCLACHQIDGLGQVNEFGGGDLSDVGSKRSTDWLAHWLIKPEQLNSTHRMPLVQLSSTERRQIAVYLAGLKADNDEQPPESAAAPTDSADAIAAGRRLIEQHNCRACHEISGIKREPQTVALMDTGAEASCVGISRPESQTTQPHYTHAPQEALTDWVKQLRKHADALEDETPARFIRGADLLVEKNCLACHSRDRHPGNVALAGKIAQLDSRLSGQSQGLIPPHLTAVGDRLQDGALGKALAGEQPRRLPWLSVRMPRFEHSESEAAQLKEYVIGHDRLPDPIPDSRLQLTPAKLNRSAELLTGRELTGGRAFNCIACHKMGDYEPRNTALGTKGSNLLGVAGRLRPEYFLRWTRSAIRVVPGMEMPSFDKPRPGFELVSLDDQLSAIWRAINDPTFTAPSNPTVVEQYLVVAPKQPARIVRDVFESPASQEKQREFIPRPFAVGFNNGHSLLFDLDRASLAGWSYGDFAFQEAEGKSWFWQLAGAQIAGEWDLSADLRLRAASDPEELISPEISGVRKAFLRSYRNIGEGVELEYELRFSVAGESRQLTVNEHWSPLPEADDASGWQRAISVLGVPGGYDLVFNQSAQKTVLGEPALLVNGVKTPLKEGRSVSFDRDRKSGVSGPIGRLKVDYVINVPRRATHPYPAKPEIPSAQGAYAGLNGFHAQRLPLTSNLMPTSLTWTDEGELIFSSLKGQVYRVDDANADGLPDQLQLIQDGLAAPFGVIAQGDELLVAHKPEILSLSLNDNVSQPTVRSVYSDGWGHSDNYHDWISGFAKDETGRLHIGTGSNYSQKGRPKGNSMHRGEVLALAEDGTFSTIGTELRYPTGIAADPHGRIFASDQQGVQNCFNEINHIVPGGAYGVTPLYHEPGDEKRASIQLPHPWTRSVNGLFFIPEQDNLRGLSVFAGQGIGCEYNNRFLVRFSLQEVNGQLQGAAYELTRSAETLPPEARTFLGPMCGGVGPDGNIYIGGMHDSGWRGGPNVGEIVQLQPPDQFANGIREVRATPDGFEIEFLEPLDAEFLSNPDNYDLSGYTRVWQGSYASPESGRYRVAIESIDVLEAGRKVRLTVDELKTTHVYDVLLKNQPDLFPNAAYYTMNVIPES